MQAQLTGTYRVRGFTAGPDLIVTHGEDQAVIELETLIAP